MKNHHFLIICVLQLTLLSLVITGCKKYTGKASATGNVYDMTIVMDKTPLSIGSQVRILQAIGDTLDNTRDLVHYTMSNYMPCLPQAEPYFKLTEVTHDNFTNVLRPCRNVLIVEIDRGYHQVMGEGKNNVYSKPQAVYTVKAPSEEAFVNYWLEHGEEIRDWFIRQEMARQVDIYRQSTQSKAVGAVKKRLGADIIIPDDYILIRDTSYIIDGKMTDIIWCANTKGDKRRDIVIYATPVTDRNSFNVSYMVNRRNLVMCDLATTSDEDSYMSTETRYVLPEGRFIPGLHLPEKTFYGYELRGLWRMEGGIAMGGPFVSHTRVDKVNKKLITVEAYIYASGRQKRIAYRQAESILYSLRLSEELQ